MGREMYVGIDPTRHDHMIREVIGHGTAETVNADDDSTLDRDPRVLSGFPGAINEEASPDRRRRVLCADDGEGQAHAATLRAVFAVIVRFIRVLDPGLSGPDSVTS